MRRAQPAVQRRLRRDPLGATPVRADAAGAVALPATGLRDARAHARPFEARYEHALLAAILAVGALVRIWDINALGVNSDEAVYLGQGASIAGVHALEPFFPTFRAHPLLFQTVLSLGFKLGSPVAFGRLVAAAFGLATVAVTWRLGRTLYGPRTGLLAAAVLALMPYHVVVSRQVLLDGPMAFWSTVTLYLLARFAQTERWLWLYAAAGTMGLTFLSKESSVILLGACYAFLALTPELETRWRHYVGAGALFGLVASVFPLAVAVAGKTSTGGDFLAWQLFRRPNHTLLFYPTVIPVAMGALVPLAALLGLWLMRRENSWRERLMLAWIAVPVAFFQVFPIKGFQYLLPIAPPVAVLAARFLAGSGDVVPLRGWLSRISRGSVVLFAITWVGVSLAIATWHDVQPSHGTTFLAGSGGVPGGREAGRWIARNVPEGARMMSVGPSMANILQFYGRRKIYGLSVSPNPLHRNPVYEALRNPDRSIRDNELQYVVWDAFSASRTPFFSQKLLRYVERYNGRDVHSETVPLDTAGGRVVHKPVIRIYEVRP